MSRDEDCRAQDAGASRDEARGPRAVDARELLGGSREIVIVHRGERYRLRVTQHDKLILTK